MVWDGWMVCFRLKLDVISLVRLMVDYHSYPFEPCQADLRLLAGKLKLHRSSGWRKISSFQ